MLSDHAPFYKAGINTAYFTGANYSVTGSFEPRESKSYPNIIGTPDDTLENYIEYYGDTGYQKGHAVLELLIKAFMSDGFEGAMTGHANRGAYGILYNETFRIAVYAFLTAALLAFAYLFYRKIKRDGAADEPDKPSRIDCEKMIVFDEFGI
jgi:hypothetical protein